MNNIKLTIDQTTARKFHYQNKSDMDSPYGKPRVYVEWPNYSVLENLVNRNNRPYNLIKKQLEKLLRDNGIKFDKMSWSKFAGCTMCACSGGFILTGSKLLGFDMWVKMEVTE